MAGFNFERDLPHQVAAVDAIADVFDSVGFSTAATPEQNNCFNLNIATLKANITALQKTNSIKESVQVNTGNDLILDSLILDINMETGTGKTYAYTKTLFELNKQFGLFKFIVAVPRVAIKAGAVSFLKSDAARAHFNLDYKKQIKVYEVQAQKKSKGKKDFMPQSIMDFCRADSRSSQNTIHVLVINAGMINSPTMTKKFDVALFDAFNVAFDAIAHTKSVLIIDEPHLFKTDNKTFENIRKFQPQFTVRYGATFDNDYKNLVYQLTAVNAFNQDLVKGIVAHVEQFDEGSNTRLKLVNLAHEAVFELTENNVKKTFKLAKKESLSRVHAAMQSLDVTDFNKTKLVLSNGLELRKGDVINPFSYAETLQNKMLQQAIVRHFEIERNLLLQQPRIKPLSLFFIDNIASYRDKDGAMRVYFEASIKAHIEALITKEQDATYKAHLQTALSDLSALHGGYFSADNSDKDEAIEQETLEILHDKEGLLSIDNPRRFIFSKWTLREGWDNPNIFQICKLRSSGSETSKLQEVGRGLRLPVNEYMSRDKSQVHDLHYYVDFTEKDFIEKLTNEINDKSGVSFNQSKLDDSLVQALLKAYPAFKNDEALLEQLGDDGIIKRNNDFKEGGFEQLKQNYPLAFGTGLKANKVKTGEKTKVKATIRVENYSALKTLWEAISQKVVLEYKLDNTNDFKKLFKSYLVEHQTQFVKTGSISEQQRLVVEQNRVSYQVERSVNAPILPFKMMGYHAFLMTLSKELALSIAMLHAVFAELLATKQLDMRLDINAYMSLVTIRSIKKGFNDYLMQHVFGQFKINYRQTTNTIHPTKLTNAQGEVLNSIESSDVGVLAQAGSTPPSYLFAEYFYDSQIELDNIQSRITEVVIYTKIPKNSIRIPLVGGGTYSPDFAYVLKSADGKNALNLVVESKDKTEVGLATEEAQKIKHAEAFFNQLDKNIKISFKKQLQDKKMVELIKEVAAN